MHAVKFVEHLRTSVSVSAWTFDMSVFGIAQAPVLVLLPLFLLPLLFRFFSLLLLLLLTLLLLLPVCYRDDGRYDSMLAVPDLLVPRVANQY